jgi:hypothetical protein
VIELATNTIMADNRIGSQSAARATIRVLLKLAGQMQEVDAKLHLAHRAVK